MLLNVIDKVENILKTNHWCRSSDIYLLYEYYKTYHAVDHDTPFRDVLKMIKYSHAPSFESIRRSRQKIQEGGKYQSNDRVGEARRELQLEIKQEF